MYYADEVIEEVRQRNDIVDVISQYVRLKKKGSSYFGLCPFHNEKSPSFSVSRDKQMYYCFGCGAGGNLYTFLMEYENYSFPEAVQRLAREAGMELPEMEESGEAKSERNYINSLLEIQKQAAGYYYYQLKSQGGLKGREYLEGRQLSWETVRQFGLGYSGRGGNHLYRYLKNRGYADELLRDSGLFQADEKQGMYDKFWNRVIFPIADAQNRVIGFGGRVMGDGKPKYLNSPETKIFDKSRNLYGLNRARSSRKKNLIICEGYMDVIAMHQAGFNNAVASLGTALTMGHANLMKRYTKEVLMIYDSDEAGVKAALRGIPILRSAGLHARVVDLSPYKDPDEFIKAQGAEKFQERLDQAQNSFLFQIRMLEREFDLRDPQGKTDFFRGVAERLLEFTEDLERNNYIEAIADGYHIEKEQLHRMVNSLALAGVRYQKPRQPDPAGSGRKQEGGEGARETAQKLMLTWLVNHPGIFSQVERYLKPEDFTTPLYQKVARMLYQQQEQEGHFTPARIWNQFQDPQEQKGAAALLNTTLPVDTREEQERAFADTLLRILEDSLQKQRESLSPGDLKGLQENINKEMELKKMKANREQLHISFE